MKRVLGVKISDLDLAGALQKAQEFLNSSGQYKIFTPNPEMLVDAQKDEYFTEVLNSGDLNVCDGFGLSLVSRAKRLPGVDLMMLICQIAESKNKSIYLVDSLSKNDDDYSFDLVDEECRYVLRR